MLISTGRENGISIIYVYYRFDESRRASSLSILSPRSHRVFLTVASVILDLNPISKICKNI